MAIRFGINGFGRIGRLVYRAIRHDAHFDLVAINDLTDAPTMAHLLKYDSVHGRIDADIIAEDDTIRCDGDSFKVYSERDPEKLPWKQLEVDYVIESTGVFRTKEKAGKHLTAGAKKVLISAPAKGEGVPHYVVGVNDDEFDPKATVLSIGSCTTNCLAPVAKVINDAFGIAHGTMTTIHAYTNDQRILDLPHSDLRRARAAAVSMIPTTTGAAKAIGLVIPELQGKLDGFAVRVPTPCGSLVDCVCLVEKETTVEEVNAAVKAASEKNPDVLGYSEEPLVSVDIIGDGRSSVFDALSTIVVGGKLVKVVSWYDNEWGFSCRMVDVLRLMAGA
jgi:glyceraldehyde 3-phosphate dehydrogenase